MATYHAILDHHNFAEFETPAGELKKIWESAADAHLRKLIQIEIDCLNFSFWQGKLIPIFSNTDKTGITINEYPAVKNFDQESIRYIIERLKQTPNKRLQANYGQILWTANVKNKGPHVQTAINAYLQLLENSNSDDTHFYSDFINVLFLSTASKYKVEPVKKLLINSISSAQTPYDAYVILTPKVLELQKFFSKEEIETVKEKAEQIWTDSNKLSLFSYERIAENAINVLKALKLNPKHWYNRLGEWHEKTIDLRKDDDTGMMPIHFCERAIHFYKLAGNREKEKELLKRLIPLKANLKLSTVELKFSGSELTELMTYHKKVIANILQTDPNIIKFLCTDTNIFPTFNSLNETVAARDKSILDLVSVIKYDINKNTSRTKSKDEELTAALLDEYNWYVQIVSIPFLIELFKEGLLEQKLNFRTMIEYLHKHSWIAKNISYRDSGGEPFEHNWLALITPALVEFFLHWQALHYSESKFQNFILCIDSLATKFEGLLRDFARLIGASSQVHSKGWNREAYIEELLQEEKIKNYLNEDDLLLFKYLFTTNGKNIRNNVAHSFYKFHHYKPELAILLIMAILRISKYQVNADKIIL